MTESEPGIRPGKEWEAICPVLGMGHHITLEGRCESIQALSLETTEQMQGMARQSEKKEPNDI